MLQSHRKLSEKFTTELTISWVKTYNKVFKWSFKLNFYRDQELRRLGISKADVGLYRDDGLMMLNSSRRNLNKIRQRLEQLFRGQHLEIKVEHGMQSADFLDVTMHLTSQEHEPYRKDDALPRYINIDSNHPPVIKKRLPDMIAKRVSGLCSRYSVSKKILWNHRFSVRGWYQVSWARNSKHCMGSRSCQNPIFYFSPLGIKIPNKALQTVNKFITIDIILMQTALN